MRSFPFDLIGLQSLDCCPGRSVLLSPALTKLQAAPAWASPRVRHNLQGKQSLRRIPIDQSPCRTTPRFTPKPRAAQRAFTLNYNATQNSQQSIGIRYTATASRPPCRKVNDHHRFTSAQGHRGEDRSRRKSRKATSRSQAIQCPAYVFTSATLIARFYILEKPS